MDSRFFYHFIALCILLSFEIAEASQDLYRCPTVVRRDLSKHYSVRTFQDKCYVFVSREGTWITARERCHNWGGELVSIPNEHIMKFLKRTLGSLRWTNTGTWIGANSRSGGVWRWTTGERLQWGYWAPGQPSKSLGLFSIEDCALMKRQDGYRWHDYHCDTDMFFKYRSVCDFPYENAHIDADQASSTGDRQLEPDSSTNKDSLLIGFISGAIVVLLLAVFGFIFCRKRFQRKKPMDEMSVRFENLNYARVNQLDQGPQRAQSNIYMDTTDMNRLYDVVTKQVDHGVNRYDTQYTSTLQAKGGAEGGKDMCCSEDPDYETPVKNCSPQREDNPPAPPLPCLNNRRPLPVREGEYVDMSAGSRQGKATNLINEANRVVDPSKPSNLEQRMESTDQPMYANDNAVNEALEHSSDDESIRPILHNSQGESTMEAEQIYETVQ
ncbi:uncharacterized protein LOC110463911 isoform X2 [Mizuhopecten yessoensis]|uniref:Low affinity immunoglobulin epsilon Fc receptor n=1 Tax=Mizuhopecten yessoensis TaxID=6573 RepID=A0A210PV30_MIZYE|nr:uncharacterized protein LOC110463911 isoform X2 [Mizuhopecten yessoensis]OWF40350.1 Low affinity immunoglobulin epsilon Fc receptor [Mizuhopecten yessoensis]